MTTAHARLAQASLHLFDAAGGERRIALTQSWTLLHVAAADDYAFVIDALDALPEAFILAQDGGLLGTLDIDGNFALALQYREADNTAEERPHAEQTTRRLFAAAGLSVQEIDELGKAIPLDLPRPQRWLAGFVRAILLAPELLVIERPLAGLPRQESLQILQWLALFPLYHPFRHALILDQHEDMLPQLTDSTIEHL